MKNNMSPANLVARSTAIMGALSARVRFSPPPPDFCPSGNAGVAL